MNTIRKSLAGGWQRWTAATLTLVVVASAVAMVSRAGSHQGSPAMTAEQKIARGRQIAYSSACIDCHTPGTFYGSPDTTRMLSGSELGWEGPWGITYPRNLTPDPETGIASWTEEDIVTAIRTGHRPDQTPILPPMPWTAYAHMSDEDVYALAAFIKSLPPVKHKVPDKLPPGVASNLPKLSFPPPPAWDAMNLPQAPSDEELAANSE